MRIAVIGAGPAGFYASAALLRRFGNAHVDMIERLPVPFGLVRYGVAPDHPSTRNVISQFSSMMEDNPRLTFFGNIRIGDNHNPDCLNSVPALPYDYLSSLYDSVVFATGAARPRSLNVLHNGPEATRNVYSAHDFVLWLNGHPDLHKGGERQQVGESISQTLLTAKQVSVIGAGNVAIDVSRLLLRPRKDLAMLDASPSALRVLSKAPSIQNVDLFARRSPPFARWTTAALREICSKVPGIVVRTDSHAARASVNQPGIKLSRSQVRMLDVLTRHTVDSNESMQARLTMPDHKHYLTLIFDTAVNRFSMKSGKLQLHLRKTDVTHMPDDSSQTAEQIHTCDAVFLSLGYESGDCPPSGLAVGWANGMARGIIGDNKWDAESVVAAMPFPISNSSKPGVREWLRESLCNAVTWDGWLRIDAEETRRAQQAGMKTRCRVESLNEMLRIANGL